jgi:ABC-2 type transport system permease protein
MISSVDLAVARRAFRQVWIGAAVWALVFGGTVAASATTYVTSFPDQASRRLLATSTGSASRDVVAPRRFGLRSVSALTVRLELPVLVAWGAGVVAAGFAFGIIGKVATGEVPSSISDTLDNFGVHGDFVRQYFGVAFLLVATIVGLLPASQIGAAADEETSGRLVHVLVQPARRVALLGGRLALCCIAIVASGLLAGLAAWLGAETQGVHPGFGRMVVAGLNVVPTALVVLGIGAVMLATFPRASTRTVYAVVVWSLIIDLLGSMISSVRWLDHLSLFHYMALAPAEHPKVATIVITLSVAATLCLAALLVFERRDIETG